VVSRIKIDLVYQQLELLFKFSELSIFEVFLNVAVDVSDVWGL